MPRAGGHSFDGHAGGGEAILIRTLRCGKGTRELAGRSSAIGSPGSAISMTVPVKTAPYCQADWHGGTPVGDTPHVLRGTPERRAFAYRTRRRGRRFRLSVIFGLDRRSNSWAA